MKHFSFVPDQKGGAMVMAMVIVALTTVAIGASMVMSSNTMNTSSLQRGITERQQVFNTMKSVFADQRYCSAIFPMGGATPEGKYYIADSALAYSVDPTPIAQRFKDIADNFGSYELASINLGGRADLGQDKTGVSYTEYNVGFTVRPKNAGIGVQLMDSFGALSPGNSRDEKLKVVFGNDGRCFLHNYASTEDRETGLALSCKGLGGQYEAGRCNIKEYAMDAAGLANVDAAVTTESSFKDALCATELYALQKIGPHLVQNSGDNRYGWTSFCQKPKWAGCRDNHGNMRLSGAAWSQEDPIAEFNARETKEFVKNFIKPTLDRRVNRVTAARTSEAMGTGMYPDIAESDTDFKTRYQSVLNDPVILTSILQGGMIDPVMVVVASLFAPRCNRARIWASFRCGEGFTEVDQVRIDIQKMKISTSGIKCKWRSATSIDVPTEYDIATLLNDSTYLNNLEDIKAEELADDDISEILASLKGDALTFEELMAMFAGADDEEIIDPNVPDALEIAFLDKEMALWVKFDAEARAAMTSVLTAPRAKGASEASDEYLAYLTTFYNDKKQEFDVVNLKMKNYYNFSKGVVLAGGPRVLTTSPVYTDVISPLITKMNSDKSTLISNATDAGVSLIISAVVASN